MGNARNLMVSADAIDADDLPDIVDVVMEMGRSEGAPSSPPLVLDLRQGSLPTHLEKLADRARDYVEAASSANTRRGYAADWKHFCAWCRRQSFDPLPPDPQIVGLYITAQASGSERHKKSVSTIERRLSSLTWN
ncbi:MAG: integrase, partial [Mesorhizobium sp.]